MSTGEPTPREPIRGEAQDQAHHPDQTAHGPHDVPHDDRAPGEATGAGRRPGMHPEIERASRTKPAVAGAIALGVIGLLVFVLWTAGLVGG
jgi:hypothetical protein